MNVWRLFVIFSGGWTLFKGFVCLFVLMCWLLSCIQFDGQPIKLKQKWLVIKTLSDIAPIFISLAFTHMNKTDTYIIQNNSISIMLKPFQATQLESLICCVFIDALFRNALAPWCGHSAGSGLWRWPTACHPNVGPPFCHITPESSWEPHKVSFLTGSCSFLFLVIPSNTLHLLVFFFQGNSVHFLEPGWLWASSE